MPWSATGTGRDRDRDGSSGHTSGGCRLQQWRRDRRLREVFRSWGLASEIYCEAGRILPELREDARDLSRAASECTAEDLVLLHLSIGSDANLVFPDLPGPKVLRYHNVTPPEYFRALNDHLARQLELGRTQMRDLAGVADLNLAVSRYNAGELEEAGYPNVQVHPLVLTLKRLEARPNPSVLNRFDDDMINILFVGRCAPNKRLEDLLHALHYVQRFVEPRTRLIHVGSFAGTEQYLALLKTMARDLQLRHVNFMGSVPEDHLCAYYQLADVFLCMSEHEGFGIPLLEAMQAGIPVLAHASAAVPETLDGAGVMFGAKLFDELAEWIVNVARPGELRTAILAGQQERLKRYAGLDLETRLRDLLAPWLS